MERRELSFVPVCGNTKKDVRATNKVVRAHVMRRYKQQQRISMRKAREEEEQKDTTDEVVEPSLTSWLDGELDPFQCLPVHLTRRELMLLQQNASTTIRTSVHADPFDIYRKSCSKDPAWLFMNMFYASNRFSKSHEHTERYLLQSISAVNESIGRSPNEINDSTIATVACLANIENLNGVASHAAVHIQGLQRMVEMRGGSEHLCMRGILRRLVLWSDLLHSSSSERPACFPFYAADNTAHISTFILPASRRAEFLIHTNPDLDDITTAKSNICLLQILRSLHELSTFLSIIGGDGSSHEQLPWEVAYPDRVYHVEYQIVTSLFDDDEIMVASSDVKAKLGILILHASLLFIYTNLRQTPVGARIRARLTARLRQALDETDIENIALRFPAEVLWIVLIGVTSRTAKGDDEHYFTQLLRRMCAVHDIKTSFDMQMFLMGLPTLVSERWRLCREILENGNLSSVRQETCYEIHEILNC